MTKRWTNLSAGEVAAKSAKNRAAWDQQIEVYLQIAVVSEANQRDHWAVKARRAKSQRQQAYLLTGALKTLRLPARIMLVRVGGRAMDTDNLVRAFKSVRDGIADRLEINDGSYVVTWQYDQIKGEPKQRGIKVVATSVETAA